jgi:hypothetical protein
MGPGILGWVLGGRGIPKIKCAERRKEERGFFFFQKRGFFFFKNVWAVGQTFVFVDRGDWWSWERTCGVLGIDVMVQPT